MLVKIPVADESLAPCRTDRLLQDLPGQSAAVAAPLVFCPQMHTTFNLLPALSLDTAQRQLSERPRLGFQCSDQGRDQHFYFRARSDKVLIKDRFPISIPTKVPMRAVEGASFHRS